MSTTRRFLVGGLALALLVAVPLVGEMRTPLVPAAVADTAPTVPLLTGGLMISTGTVGATLDHNYNCSGTCHVQESTGPVGFSETDLVEGLFPGVQRAPASDWPSQGPAVMALAWSPAEVHGHWSETVTDSSGTRTSSCQTTAQTERPFSNQDMVPGDSIPIPEGMQGNFYQPQSTCDNTDVCCPTMDPLNEEAGAVGRYSTQPDVPATPWKATSTVVASGDDTSHSQSDPYATFTLTNARVTLACAICISDITFKQLDDPSSGEEAKSVVPDTGTYDGNVVEISATVHNAANRMLSVPFSFIDKTTGKPLNEADGDRLVEPQTIGAGATTTITFDWDTRGTAWRHMQPMPTHTIQVLTGFGGAQRDITVLPKPVVLVHGWNSDASTWETMKSLLTAKDEHWPVFAVGDSWSQAGMTMDTDPVSGNSIEANARAEARYIEHVRSLTKAQHVDLVVHSMGGLISRDYIDHMMMGEPHPPGGRPLVSHLVMLGTPNQGSACAYAAGGAAVYFGKAVPTIQLTPVYVADIFDKYVRNQHGVPFSVDAGTGYPVCFTGDGDGVVTRDSAWWIYSDVGERPGDLHTDLPSDPAIADQWVMDHVAKAWFEESTPSGRRPSSAPEPPPAVQQVAIEMPAVARGHDVIVKVPVTTAKRLEVILVGPASVAATLLRPTGAVSVSQKAGSTAARRPFRSLQVAKPTAGMWKLRLHQTAAASANVMLSASLQGATKTEGVSLSRLSGRRLKVTAKLRKGTHPITGATAQALLRRTGGRLITIGLVDNGTHGDARAHDGIYTATTAALPVGDYYVVGKAVKATMRRYVASAISIR